METIPPILQEAGRWVLIGIATGAVYRIGAKLVDKLSDRDDREKKQ